MPADADPLVSVIVPVWNRPDDIRLCVAALCAQTLPRDRYEILVVDNGSSDDTAAVAASFPGVTVLSEAAPGSYAARNRGLAAARGRFAAFTDSDCRAAEGWLAAALAAAEAAPEAGLIAGRIELDDEAAARAGVCEAYERAFSFNQAKNVENGVAATANWLARRDLLIDLGGFRSDLKSGGDFEFARRIAASGRPIRYAPDAVVHHPVRATFAELIGKSRRVMGGLIDRRAGFRPAVRRAWITARNCAWRVRGVWRMERLGAPMKFKLSLLLVALAGSGVAEIVRLMAGGEARRA